MSGAIWAIFTKDSTSLENQTLAVDERFPKTAGRPSEPSNSSRLALAEEYSGRNRLDLF